MESQDPVLEGIVDILKNHHQRLNIIRQSIQHLIEEEKLLASELKRIYNLEVPDHTVCPICQLLFAKGDIILINRFGCGYHELCFIQSFN